MFSHRFLFLQRCSPTDFTDLHRTFAEKTPTDFTHRSYGAFKGGGALVSSAPTQQNLYSPTEFRTHSCWDILPQISQIYTELSCWEKFCFLC